jgi:hypothetical protein
MLGISHGSVQSIFKENSFEDYHIDEMWVYGYDSQLYHHHPTKTVGPTSRVSNSALHEMLQTVALGLGLLYKVPR